MAKDASSFVTRWKYGLLIFGLTIVFLLDCITARGYAVWLGYVMLVIGTILVEDRRAPWLIAGVSTPLILIGFFASHAGNSSEVDLVNRSLCLALLWIVAACLTAGNLKSSSTNVLSPYRLQSSIATAILLPIGSFALISAFVFWQLYQVLPHELLMQQFQSGLLSAVLVIAIAMGVLVVWRISSISSSYAKALESKERTEQQFRSLTKEFERRGTERSGEQATQAIAGKACSASPNPPQNTRIPVLLVDDHAMVRQGLRSIMETFPDIEIVGEASNGQEAVKLVERRQPAVVLMDINMPKLNGIEATARIKSDYPHVSIIGLSVNAESHNQEAMKKAGAVMLLPKEAVVGELHKAIHSVVASQ